eukprot:10361463-Karenia_brevis.AAC.1
MRQLQLASVASGTRTSKFSLAILWTFGHKRLFHFWMRLPMLMPTLSCHDGFISASPVSGWWPPSSLIAGEL